MGSISPTPTTKPTKTHRAAILTSAKTLTLSPTPTTPPSPHDLQISPRATGLCGTDQHYYANGRNGIYPLRSPLILGHEASGIVLSVGTSITTFRPGDRVVLEPQVSCLTCLQCRSGRYNLCKKMRFNGSASAEPPAQGSLQDVMNHPAALCYKLPESVSFEEGALVEPLSVALHSVRKGGLEPGQGVLITGAGAIGLLCARIAKISGASRVVMVDVDGSRLAFAKKHGFADRIVEIPMRGEEGEGNAEFVDRMAGLVREVQGDAEPDLALECTGVESCLNICIGSAAPRARIALVGMGVPRQQVNLGVALVKEMEILGVWRYTNTFQSAIDLIEAGMVDVKPMITHTFDIEEIVKALEFTLERPASLVKCVVTSKGQGP